MFNPKSMLVQSAWTGPPASACKLALAGRPAQPCFAPLQVLFDQVIFVTEDHCTWTSRPSNGIHSFKFYITHKMLNKNSDECPPSPHQTTLC